MAKPKKDPKEYGKRYVDKILSKIPEAQRESVKSLLDVDTMYEDLGSDVLRQEDYSRMANENQALNQQLNDWFATHNAKLYDYDRLAEENQKLKSTPKPDLDPYADPPKAPAIDTSRFIDRDTFQREAANLTGHITSLLAAVPALTVSHFKEFGEVLDTGGLFKYVQDNRLPIDRGYEQFVAERRGVRQEEQWKQKIKEAREEGRREAAIGGSLPYPVGPEEPSTLSGLTATNKDNYSVAAAVKAFNDLRAKNGS